MQRKFSISEIGKDNMSEILCSFIAHYRLQYGLFFRLEDQAVPILWEYSRDLFAKDSLKGNMREGLKNKTVGFVYLIKHNILR